MTDTSVSPDDEVNDDKITWYALTDIPMECVAHSDYADHKYNEPTTAKQRQKVEGRVKFFELIENEGKKYVTFKENGMHVFDPLFIYILI